jgi:hypothetical protein
MSSSNLVNAALVDIEASCFVVLGQRDRQRQANIAQSNHHNPLFVRQFYNSAPQPRDDNSPSD